MPLYDFRKICANLLVANKFDSYLKKQRMIYNENRGEDMYKHKLEKDIRCPLKYGLELFGESGSRGYSVCCPKKKP